MDLHTFARAAVGVLLLLVGIDMQVTTTRTLRARKLVGAERAGFLTARILMTGLVFAAASWCIAMAFLRAPR